MSGAVPCLSTDLTTHAVPNFIQALQMGRRTAPKTRGAEGAERFRAKRDEVCSSVTCGVLFGARWRTRARRRCVPRRVSASAKAQRLAALPTSGGLGRYWAAQWHLARAVDKRFRGCRAKRLYLHYIDCPPTPGVRFFFKVTAQLAFKGVSPSSSASGPSLTLAE